jgi:hypothetical protein
MERPATYRYRNEQERPPMQICKLHPHLEIAISPDDCLLLARACRHAADVTQEGGPDDVIPDRKRSDSYLFYLMACTLEGYALINDADTRMGPRDRAGWDLATLRKEWSPLAWDGGAK